MKEMAINKWKIRVIVWGWVFLSLIGGGVVRAEEEMVTERGEATAVIESVNEVNSNLGTTEVGAEVSVGESTAEVVSEESQSVGESIVDTNVVEVRIEENNEIATTAAVIIENNNQAEVTTDSLVQTETGNNEVETDNANVKVESGEATALAEVINLININVVGSGVGIYVVNNFDGSWGSLDLNGIWQKLIEGNGVQVIKNGNSGEKIVVISNKNLAKISNQVTVIANSGDNTVTGGNEALIISGEATALANVINLVNINLVGSNLFIGVVNVSGTNLGDIILPNPETFKSEENSGGVTGGTNNNLAVVNNQSEVRANSGTNSEVTTTETKIESGGATALNNEVTVANINAEAEGQMWVLVNVLGQSTGKIYNWSYPGSVENFGDEQMFFILNGGGCLSCQGGEDTIFNENQAEVNNEILAVANSGENKIEEAREANIKSGAARAVVNLTNLVNLNIQGSQWFWGIINIFGNWGGNVIFAYPDLAVSLTADRDRGRSGEEVLYRVDYGNLGEEEVEEAELEIELPREISYVGDDSNVKVFQDGNKFKWKIANLLAKSGNSFYIKLKLEESQDRKDVEARVAAVISSGKTESDLSNNRSSWATIIWYPSDTSSENKGVAKMEVTAKNNVNDYVLPGDTVTFQIKVKNSGEEKIKEAVLIHEIFDEEGNLWSSNQIYLGDIELNKEGIINFGIVMEGAGGKYISKTWIAGRDEKDNEIYSNIAETSFEVKRKMVVIKRGEVLAAENEVGAVSDGGFCSVEKTFWPYLMLFILSSLWLQKQLRVWLRKK